MPTITISKDTVKKIILGGKFFTIKSRGDWFEVSGSYGGGIYFTDKITIYIYDEIATNMFKPLDQDRLFREIVDIITSSDAVLDISPEGKYVFIVPRKTLDKIKELIINEYEKTREIIDKINDVEKEIIKLVTKTSGFLTELFGVKGISCIEARVGDEENFDAVAICTYTKPFITGYTITQRGKKHRSNSYVIADPTDTSEILDRVVELLKKYRESGGEIVYEDKTIIVKSKEIYDVLKDLIKKYFVKERY